MIYEILVLTINDINEAKKIFNNTKTFFSKISLEDFWGAKKLAYKINNQETGCYFLIIGESDNVFEKMKYEKKTNNKILRYMILNLYKELKSDEKIKKYIEGKLITKFEYRKESTFIKNYKGGQINKIDK